MTKEKEIRYFEELAMNAWPAQETHYYDGWVLRFTEGYTKRANSINPLYSSSIELDRKVLNCEAIYEEKGLRPIFKLSEYAKPNHLDEVLALKGYKRLDEVSVQVLDLKRSGCNFIPEKTPMNPRLLVEEEMTQEWIQAYIRCSGIHDPVTIGIMTNLLFCISRKVLTICLFIEEDPIACAFGVSEGETIGFFDVVTHKDARNQGHATLMMKELIRQSLNKGMTIAYLQVLTDNQIAMELYKKLGFTENYRYWYRIK